jgi:hypothetical protein
MTSPSARIRTEGLSASMPCRLAGGESWLVCAAATSFPRHRESRCCIDQLNPRSFTAVSKRPHRLSRQVCSRPEANIGTADELPRAGVHGPPDLPTNQQANGGWAIAILTLLAQDNDYGCEVRCIVNFVVGVFSIVIGCLLFVFSDTLFGNSDAASYAVLIGLVLLSLGLFLTAAELMRRLFGSLRKILKKS